MNIPLDEVVHFDEITVGTDRAAVDADDPPTFSVFEEATDTPILEDVAMTKRTSLVGNYRGTFTCSAANGFEVGKFYNVIATATVNSISGKKRSLTCRIVPAETAAGVPKVDAAFAAGVVITDSDFTLENDSNNDGTSLTLPSTDAAGDAVPNDDSHAGKVLQVVGGTGKGQTLILTTREGSTRQWYVFAGTQIVQTDDTSQVNVIGQVRLDLAIKAKTDPLPASPAAVGSAMTLADDAITAAKYDESTAFPLKANDAGATQVARVGADGDTLETLSDQLDAKASQSSVDDLPTNSELATALAAADDAVLAAIAALSIPTANQNADALLDRADAIETAVTVRKALRGIASAAFGKASGLATTTAVYRNAVADSKDRITATVDADGNRSAVSTDLT